MGQLDTTYHEHADGALTVARSQDCTAIAEHCKSQHNAGAFGSSEVKHAASIPLIVVEKYCNEQGINLHEFLNNPAHIRRVVMNPDNSAFRIWPGKI